jgi:hypothetical protein
MTQPKIKPRYQVKKLDGTYLRHIAVYVPVLDEDGNKTGRRLEYEEREVPRGWMVFFPNGSSVHIETEAELKRMGYDKPPTLVDLETGDDIDDGSSMDLEKDVQRKTRSTRHSNVSAIKKG